MKNSMFQRLHLMRELFAEEEVLKGRFTEAQRHS